MNTYPCFLLTPTDLYERLLHRYDNRLEISDKGDLVLAPCSFGQKYHSAYQTLNCIESEEEPPTDEYYNRSDVRWPRHCRCGFVFTPEDAWGVVYRRFYVRQDTDELMTLEEAPVGATWSNLTGRPVSMTVRTPLGDVDIYQDPEVVNAIITGAAPNFTLSEPIRGHWWLRGGRLIYMPVLEEP